MSLNFFQCQSSDALNLYQRQCLDVLKFNTEAQVSLRISSDKASNLPKRDVRFILLK